MVRGREEGNTNWFFFPSWCYLYVQADTQLLKKTSQGNDEIKGKKRRNRNKSFII